MDEKLIKKAIKGNFKAYSLLVHSLKNEGYKLAYTILKNEQDSIDAYLQAVEKGLKNTTVHGFKGQYIPDSRRIAIKHT